MTMGSPLIRSILGQILINMPVVVLTLKYSQLPKQEQCFHIQYPRVSLVPVADGEFHAMT